MSHSSKYVTLSLVTYKFTEKRCHQSNVTFIKICHLFGTITNTIGIYIVVKDLYSHLSLSLTHRISNSLYKFPTLHLTLSVTFHLN